MHFTIIDLFITTIVFCILFSFYRYIVGSCLFVEAAIEISPIGVQLVSAYGTGATSCSVSNNTLFTTSTQSDDNYQRRRDIRYKVRSFLPPQRILDVIVVEVVWPHCVWSQVVFRVVKEDIGDLSTISCSEMQGETQGEVDGINDGCNTLQNNGDADQTTQNTRQKLQQSSQHTQTKSSRIQELLQQNQVSIVAAFPEECQGKLSYEQCLHIQAEIERLMEIQVVDASD